MLSFRQLETHIVDHCNLNCKGCSHFCPLLKEKNFTDPEIYAKDITYLSKKVHFNKIKLLGGGTFASSPDKRIYEIHSFSL